MRGLRILSQVKNHYPPFSKEFRCEEAQLSSVFSLQLCVEAVMPLTSSRLLSPHLSIQGLFIECIERARHELKEGRGDRNSFYYCLHSGIL